MTLCLQVLLLLIYLPDRMPMTVNLDVMSLGICINSVNTIKILLKWHDIASRRNASSAVINTMKKAWNISQFVYTNFFKVKNRKILVISEQLKILLHLYIVIWIEGWFLFLIKEKVKKLNKFFYLFQIPLYLKIVLSHRN